MIHLLKVIFKNHFCLFIIKFMYFEKNESLKEKREIHECITFKTIQIYYSWDFIEILFLLSVHKSLLLVN